MQGSEFPQWSPNNETAKVCALLWKCAANGVAKSISVTQGKRFKSFCQVFPTALVEVFLISFTEMFLLTLDYFDLLSKSFAYYFVQSPSWNFVDNINKLLYYSLGKLIQWKLFAKKNAFDGFGNEICRWNNSKWINAIVVWFGLQTKSTSNCSVLFRSQFLSWLIPCGWCIFVGI